MTIFTPGNFEAHSAHFLPDHVPLMWSLITGNAIIAFLYFVMPFQLLYIYFKRKDFPFRFVFFAIPFFGLWCSASHIVMIISFWYPLYYLQAIVDFITGIVSFITFLTFVPAAFNALTISSPEKLIEENLKLQAEIESHKEIKETLLQKNLELNKIDAEVKSKNEELTSLNKLMRKHELKMVDLKQKINYLKANANI